MPFEKTADYLEMKFGGSVHTWIEEDEIPEKVKKKLVDFSKKINHSSNNS